MPIFTDLRTIPMSGTGYVMPNDERIFAYVFTGSGTLAASYAVTATLSNAITAGKPHRCKILYLGQWALDGNNITFFGLKLTEQQALAGGILIDCYYNGSTWYPKVVNDSSIRSFQGTETHDITLTSPPTNVTINPNTNPIDQILIGNGTLTGNFSFGASGTILDGEAFIVKYKATMTASGHTINIFGVVLNDTEVLNGNLTVYAVYNQATTSFITQKVLGTGYDYGQKELVAVQTSYEATEVGVVSFKVPYACKLINIGDCVNKTIAGTDNGTQTFDINGTPTTPSVITTPMSTTVGTATDTEVTADNVIAAGGTVNITGAKTTAGGRVMMFLTLQRT